MVSYFLCFLIIEESVSEGFGERPTALLFTTVEVRSNLVVLNQSLLCGDQQQNSKEPPEVVPGDILFGY